MPALTHEPGAVAASIFLKLLGHLRYRLAHGLWHLVPREPPEEESEAHEDQVRIPAQRHEHDGEESADSQIGDPVERLADGHERVLGVDWHDLRDEEPFHVADTNSERDDDHHHREDLQVGHELGHHAEIVAERAGHEDGEETRAHAYPRAHYQSTPPGLIHDRERDESHRKIHKREQHRRELRVSHVRMAEHQCRVVEDSVDAGELDADLDDDSHNQLLAQILSPEQIPDRHVVAGLAALRQLALQVAEVLRGREFTVELH
mmetsp:Transcript_71588/g.141947  ORF Transcript_71588/g.141947 Transcript_71588/m.141947 type:complete len:262 (-) Transcript_71588:333-1118(-)